MKTHPVAHLTDGPATSRIDGIAKVTGRADYSADAAPEGLAHAVLIGATIARGKIASIDTAHVLAAPSVLAVLTHANAPKMKKAAAFPLGASGHRRLPFLDEEIHYQGQPQGRRRARQPGGASSWCLSRASDLPGGDSPRRDAGHR